MRIKGLGVDWYLPNKKRAFTQSTVATKDLIEVLYAEFGDLRLVYKAINYDEDAKRIVKEYIDKGIYTINIRG